MDEIAIKKVMYDGVRKLGNELILLSLLPDLYFSVLKAFLSLFYPSNYEIQLFLYFVEKKLFNTHVVKTITRNCWAYPNQCILAVGGTKCSLGRSLSFNGFIRNFPEVPLTNFLSYR